MDLNQTSKVGRPDERVTLYHASSIPFLKSFFHKGAKPIGKGLGGQKNGFYVYTGKKTALAHASHSSNDLRKDETSEALLVSVSVPKSSIVYPTWQLDMEMRHDIYNLCVKYGPFLNRHAHHLNIPLNPEYFGGPVTTVTGFSYRKQKLFSFQAHKHIFFDGIDKNGEKASFPIDGPILYMTINKFQILTDWLCRNCPDFRSDYNALMQKMLTGDGFPIKYTKKKPLPVFSIQHLTIHQNDHTIQETPLFEANKGANQVCPFLRLLIARKQKGLF